MFSIIQVVEICKNEIIYITLFTANPSDGQKMHPGKGCETSPLLENVSPVTRFSFLHISTTWTQCSRNHRRWRNTRLGL